MAYENRDINPETLGYIRLEKVRCGKLNCRCRNGKKHKAYYLYYRDCRFCGPTDTSLLIKKYIPRDMVKKMRRIIQLRKNKNNLDRFFAYGDDSLIQAVWDKIKDLPPSKMVERLHSEIKKAKKSDEYQSLTQLVRLLS